MPRGVAGIKRPARGGRLWAAGTASAPIEAVVFDLDGPRASIELGSVAELTAEHVLAAGRAPGRI
jgi:hypothetical protein